MTGRIEMVFTEPVEGKIEMACEVEIHDYTKANLCQAISHLAEHLNITEADWKTWKMSQMVKQLLADFDEMKKNGFDFEEWKRREIEVGE